MACSPRTTRRPRALASLVVLLVALCGRLPGMPPDAAAFELVPAAQLVDPAITSQPIEVVLWVRDTVSADDEAWVTGEIRAGLDLWEQVATSRLRFATRVVRSATAPAVSAAQLLVVVANRADLSAGGASLPNRFPGRWRGAAADFRDLCGTPCERFRYVAAHEIGHALGLLHSTIGRPRFATAIPLMNAAPAATGLTPDDVAAVSLAYPHPALSLHAVSATLAGRCIDPATRLPVTGVNVVAVDRATGVPVVARLSGAAGEPGRFVIVGLPPATYDLHVLDGSSFTGSSFGLPARAVQTDNFTPLGLGPFTVAAGEVVDVGDIHVPIAPLTIAGAGTSLPGATGGTAYEAAVEIHGGVRPLAIAGADELPEGLAVALRERVEPAPGVAGRVALRVHGVPRDLGHFTPAITVVDAHGATTRLHLDVFVADTLPNSFCASGLRLTNARLTLGGLASPPADESLALRGTVVFPTAVAAAFDPSTSGMQLYVEDLATDGAIVFELSALPSTGSIDGSPIPPDVVPCGPGDGWRTNARGWLYRNRSMAMDPPRCTPGSANGLTMLALRRDRRHPEIFRLALQTRRSAFATLPSGRLRVTLVFSSTSADPRVGDTCAGTLAFDAPRCVPASSGSRLLCR